MDTACANVEDLAAATAQRFAEHPDAAIITSMPGLAELSGARILAEIGDDRARFADARGLKAYAGCAPVTRASGKTTAVLHRRVKNQRQTPPRHAPLDKIAAWDVFQTVEAATAWPRPTNSP